MRPSKKLLVDGRRDARTPRIVRFITPLRASQITLGDASYLRLTLAQIWDELPLLLVGSLLVDLAAAPTILLLPGGGPVPASLAGICTLLPAWTAYAYLISRNAADIKPYWGDFLSALRHYYWRSCLLGLPLAILAPIVAATLPWLRLDLPILVIAGAALQAIVLLIICLLLLYALPLLAAFDLPLRQASSYALVLLLRWPWVATGLLSLLFLLVLAARQIGLGAWLILPALFVPFQVNAALMLAKRVVEREA